MNTQKKNGGEGGIRTHGRISPTHAFQACSLNRSDTSPGRLNNLAERMDSRTLPHRGRTTSVFADRPESKELATGLCQNGGADASNLIVGSRSQIEEIADDSDKTQRGDNNNDQHSGSSSAAASYMYLTRPGLGWSIPLLPESDLLLPGGAWGELVSDGSLSRFRNDRNRKSVSS